MKSIQTLVLFVVLLLSSVASHAITNTMIAVSGTNIVLSWPSYGYESYLVQYRQTLNSTDSWSVLTNAYPANSTNLTTFTIYGAIPSPNEMNDVMTGSDPTAASEPNEPMVMPANGSGTAVPLAIYPQGFDLSGFIIFDPATGQWVSGNGYSVNSSTDTASTGGASPMDDPSGGAVSTGFYRVFHIPNWLADFSGYTFDGPTFIPVDYAEPDAPVDHVDDATVLINGQPADGSVLIPYEINGTNYWGMGIYFDDFSNGTNTIQLLTTVRESDTLNDQTPYMTFSNAPQTIVIGNFVTYTNWNDLILSNNYTFNAQSSVTNVDWEIDIYDVNGDFVNSQTGHSDDGNISWTWDLTDYESNSRNDDGDPFFYPYITITDGSGDPSGYMPPVAKQFPSSGAWLFAYMDNFYDDGTTNYAGDDFYYTNAIHAMEGGPAEWSITRYDYPIKFGRNYTQSQRSNSWATLSANYLQSWTIRNFYYFGHGSANTIGGDINTLDSSNNITGAKTFAGLGAYLTDYWVLGNVLVNKTYGSIPFRFVFLDGCDTATSSWPVDWGVPKQAETVDYYRSSANKTGARPNAFVGWDVTIGGNKDWGTIDKFWAFRQDWMGAWANEFQRQLNDSLTEAFTDSSWVTPDHYVHLKEYGYTTMMFQEYNSAGNWP